MNMRWQREGEEAGWAKGLTGCVKGDKKELRRSWGRSSFGPWRQSGALRLVLPLRLPPLILRRDPPRR